MMINIDLLVSGCNTHCKHCYVDGGPGPMMPLKDVLLCIEKLDEMAKYLSDRPSFTLDHEPMNHPGIDQILYKACHTQYIDNYHHGMTTGVALMQRKDKEAVIKSYLDNGYNSFGITIHGAAAHHDGIVRRKGAFDMTIAAARFLRQMGCQLKIVSLMMNRYFAEDADEISRMLDALGTENVRIVSPIFTPHSSMMAFEPHRATLETFEVIRPRLADWHLNEQEVMETAEYGCIEAAVNRLHSTDLFRLWTGEQTELYLTLHPDCKFYVGNTGVETRCLGDLRTLDPKETADIINALPGNREYNAFYDEEDVPAIEDVRNVLGNLPRHLVYGDFESVLYRAFVQLGVQTKFILLHPSDQWEETGQ